MQDNTKAVVKKNNRYIRATLCYSDTQEKKLILLAISKIDSYKKQGLIKDTEPKQIDFYLSVGEIREYLGIKSNDLYKQLRETSYKIASRMMEFDTGDSFAFITPFPYCHYDKGVLHLRSELSMFNTLVNYNDAAGFTQFLFHNLKNIKSAYTIAGYEFLRSYLYLKHTLVISVEDLKNQIGVIEAVPKNPNKPLSLHNRKLLDKMPRYTDFRRFILEPMKKDFEKYTDIKITYEPKEKIGKKVISLEFTIEENTNGMSIESLKEYQRTKVTVPKELRLLVDELKTYFPKTTKNKDYLELLELSKNDISKIKDMYTYAKTQGNKVRSIVPYVKTGLKENWVVHEKQNTHSEVNTQSTIPKGAIPNTKNRFNAFPQRIYTKEFYDELEIKLIEKTQRYIENK